MNKDQRDTKSSEDNQFDADNTTATLKDYFKRPPVLIILGLIFLVPSLLSIMKDITFKDIIIGVPVIFLGAGMIAGGIMRLLKKK